MLNVLHSTVIQSAFHEIVVPKGHKVSASHRLRELNMLEMHKWMRDTQGQGLAASELHKLGEW